MKEIFRFFHKCFFALQKFKLFFILSIFFDALLQGIKLIEPWILASMLDSLYKNSKDVFLQKVATLSLIIIMQITLSYIFIRLKSYVTRGVNAACKKKHIFENSRCSAHTPLGLFNGKPNKCNPR